MMVEAHDNEKVTYLIAREQTENRDTWVFEGYSRSKL